MSTTRRTLALGVAVFAGLLAMWWWSRAPGSTPSEPDADAVGSSGLEVGEEAGIGPREASPANVDASTLDADDLDALIMEPPPDTPNERPDVSPEFEAQLLRAAELNGTGTVEEACLAWGHALALALAGDSDFERTVAFLNVADACARSSDTPRSGHELRLAHEAIVRSDPPTPVQLDRFLAEHPEFAGKRAALLVVDQHPAGTAVSLDNQRVCSEPCTLAVPIDGQPHHIAFAGPAGGEASLIWSPSAPDSAPPPLPELSAVDH